MTQETHFLLEGSIHPKHLPDLAQLLGRLGANLEVEIFEAAGTDVEPRKSTLELHDVHYNPSLTSEVKSKDGEDCLVFDYNKFTPWGKATGGFDVPTTAAATQAARSLSYYLYKEFQGGEKFIANTDFGVFLRASSVFSVLSLLERNPNIIEYTRHLGPKGVDSLSRVAGHLIIPPANSN